MIGAEIFLIQGEPERRDPDRLVWNLDTEVWVRSSSGVEPSDGQSITKERQQ
jgi:hypothetical protein